MEKRSIELEDVEEAVQSFQVKQKPLDEERLKRLWDASKSGQTDRILQILGDMEDAEYISEEDVDDGDDDDFVNGKKRKSRGKEIPAKKRMKVAPLDADLYRSALLHVASRRGHGGVVRTILNTGMVARWLWPDF